MLANEITLSVDETNDGSVTPDVNHTFRRFEESLNRTTYIHSSGHNVGSRNQLQFYRTLPTASGNFRGSRKGAFKFTKDVVVPGSDGTTITVPLIIEVKMSSPVGSSDADLMVMRQKAIKLLDNDTIMNPFQGLQEI